MFEIDQVVDLLRDNEWHELDEIVEKCKLSEIKVKGILKFLAEYGFIEINGRSWKVKVGSSLQKFLKKLKLLKLKRKSLFWLLVIH